jgi:uncharacterized protein (DUF1697 family)
MMYVALLRGINVGGNAKVEMPRLKRVFEALGSQTVSTYINSGNVIFSDERSSADLQPAIERAIYDEFKLHVPVVLRSKTQIDAICQEVPPQWTNDTEQKTDVMFLWPEVDDPSVMQKVVINPAIENVRYIDGALVWNIARANVTKGNGIKLIKTDLYKYMTIRNINTVRKLNILMQV